MTNNEEYRARRRKKYADTDISEYLTQRKYESASISIFEDLRKTENIELYIE